MGVSRAKFDMFSRPIERPIGGVGSGEGSTVSLRYRLGRGSNTFPRSPP